MERYRYALIAFVGLVLIVSAVVWSKLNAWKTFEGPVAGLNIEGHAASPPTKWYNHWYLAWRGWTLVTVFEVTTDGPYFVGYAPFDGKPQVSTKPQTAKRFRLKIGHEACTFFASDVTGKELPLRVVERTTVNDTRYADVPLL